MIYTFIYAVLGELYRMIGLPGYEHSAQMLSSLHVYEVFAIYALITVASFAVIHVFLAIGFYTMAKRRNFKNAWLAWVPIAQTLVVGKLVGEVNFFGLKIKRLGLITAIVELVAFALMIVQDVIALPYLADVMTDVFNISSKSYFVGVYNTLYAKVVPFYAAYTIISGIAGILSIVLIVLLFRQYAPRSYLLFSILSIFFPLAQAIIVFVIRKNSCEEYRNYMRMKMHAMYGGGNPYQYDDGTYTDPFNVGKTGDNKQKEENLESPFEEYEDKK